MFADWAGPAVTAAIVSSLFTAFGWLATYRGTRRLETLRRREKVIDTQAALVAEIRSNLLRFAGVDLDELRKTVLDLIGTAPRRSPFTPLVPQYAHAFIFETILGEIYVLPTEVIQDVVTYYKLEYKLSLFVQDLRHPDFAKLSPERKKLMYSDYVQMIKDTQKAGRQALRILEASFQKS
jgi:hypothetical protein